MGQFHSRPSLRTWDMNDWTGSQKNVWWSGREGGGLARVNTRVTRGHLGVYRDCVMGLGPGSLRLVWRCPSKDPPPPRGPTPHTRTGSIKHPASKQSVLQSQKAVAAYLKSKQLLPFGFASLFITLNITSGPVDHRRCLFELPTIVIELLIQKHVHFLLWRNN